MAWQPRNPEASCSESVAGDNRRPEGWNGTSGESCCGVGSPFRLFHMKHFDTYQFETPHLARVVMTLYCCAMPSPTRFAREPLTQTLWDEALPLLFAHWKEV